ncbi:MAG: septation protein IspZ [Spirochaetia bacterium]|nr:septation protein IspZ [Spirochaetia bacterium]
MEYSTLWIGIVPVLVFVILESVSGKKTALISAIALAFLELVFSLVVYGAIDELTIIGFVLVGIAVAISLKTDNDLYFKLQPAALGLIFASVFLVFYFVLDKPLLIVMYDKYMKGALGPVLADDTKRIVFLRAMHTLSRDMGFWFLLHAALTAWAAMKLSKWWWFAIRVPGLYIIMLLACFIAIRGAIAGIIAR